VRVAWVVVTTCADGIGGPQRTRQELTALLRCIDPKARDPLAQRCRVKLVLQVSVTGLKFNQPQFLEALAHKASIKPHRLRILQVPTPLLLHVFAAERHAAPSHICIHPPPRARARARTHTHTHTHTYYLNTFAYIHVYMHILVSGEGAREGERQTRRAGRYWPTSP
jgi:hypothetical protein